MAIQTAIHDPYWQIKTPTSTTTASSTSYPLNISTTTTGISLSGQEKASQRAEYGPTPMVIHKSANGWVVAPQYHSHATGETIDSLFAKAHVFTEFQQVCTFLTLHYGGMLPEDK